MEKTLIKNPTLDDFHVVSYVPWAEVEEVLGKRRYKKFCKWMNGQTTLMEGVYPWDLQRFLKGLPVID